MSALVNPKDTAQQCKDNYAKMSAQFAPEKLDLHAHDAGFYKAKYALLWDRTERMHCDLDAIHDYWDTAS